MSKIKSSVTDDEIRRACREAGCEDFAEMLIETGNGLAWAKDWLKEHGDKVSGDEKSAIEAALGELRTAKDGEDVGAIQQKTQNLLQTSMKLGEAMYKAQQEKEAAAANPADKGPDAGAGPAAGAKDEKVVDAEYEEVDEKNKKKSA